MNMALDLMERDLSSSCDVLTPLTAEELEMSGGSWFGDICGGLIGVGSAIALVATAEITVPVIVAAVLLDVGGSVLIGWGIGEAVY